jgi:hypothetical protein
VESYTRGAASRITSFRPSSPSSTPSSSCRSPTRPTPW